MFSLFCNDYRRRFDFQSPSRVDRNVEMFINIQKVLLQNKLLIFPLVYIVNSIESKLRENLTAIVKKYQVVRYYFSKQYIQMALQVFITL